MGAVGASGSAGACVSGSNTQSPPGGCANHKRPGPGRWCCRSSLRQRPATRAKRPACAPVGGRQGWPCAAGAMPPSAPRHMRLRSRTGPPRRRQPGAWAPSKARGASPRRSAWGWPPKSSTTPSPDSRANQRRTPAKAEKGPSAPMSATLMRSRQSVGWGQASSSRVTPPPLRQGVQGARSSAMACASGCTVWGMVAGWRAGNQPIIGSFRPCFFAVATASS